MIEVTFPDHADQTKPFPKIMRSMVDGTIVAFQRQKMGFVISSAKGVLRPLYFSDGWDMDKFEDYNGPVTLQNK